MISNNSWCTANHACEKRRECSHWWFKYPQEVRNDFYEQEVGKGINLLDQSIRANNCIENDYINFEEVKEEEHLSEFEQIFGPNPIGNEIPLDSLIATIRNKFSTQINSYIPVSSMASSPNCVLFAIYKLLENDLKNKEFKSYDD